MSTTDKLAQDEQCCAATNEELRKSTLEHYEDLSRECSNWCSTVPRAINFYFDAKATTVEVTAVRRVDVVSTGSRCRVMPFPEGNYVHYSDYAALVQQVERLTAEYAAACDEIRRLRDVELRMDTKIDTLSADNARLAKDAEMVNSAIGGKYIFFKERHGVVHQTTQALSQLIDFIAKKRDAAAAQAKQEEGTK